jgi:TldD protein
VKDAILDALPRSRAGYSDIRVRRICSSRYLIRDRTVEEASWSESVGGVARCCSPGRGWGAVGFAEPIHLDAHLLRAHDLSLAAASRLPVELAPIPIRQYDPPERQGPDSLELSPAGKKERLEQLAARLFELDRRVSGSRLLARDELVETWFASSEGSWVFSRKARLSVAALVVARQEGATERGLGSISVSGWDALSQFEDTLTRASARAVERLQAAPVRPGTFTVILDPRAAGILFHRAVTHLARAALPGMDADVLPIGARLGPESLTVGDDPMAPGLAGVGPYDDEGTETRRTIVLQNGVVLGHLHSRETAGGARQAPTGHARAAGLQDLPLPRVTNSFVAPGQGSFDDLLAGVRNGLYLSDALGCECSEAGVVLRPAIAWMIREGRVAEPVKGVRLQGELAEILGKVDAVAGDFQWDSAVTGCRDGAAGMVPITTGAPHLRLAGVTVGCELT